MFLSTSPQFSMEECVSKINVMLCLHFALYKREKQTNSNVVIPNHFLKELSLRT